VEEKCQSFFKWVFRIQKIYFTIYEPYQVDCRQA
jgi:hypothetical protein